MAMLYPLLFNHGYWPVHTPSSSIVKMCVRKSFDVFGETVPEVIFESLPKIYDMPLDVILLDYDLLERALNDFFRSGSEIVLNLIRQNLVEAVPDLDNQLTTRQMMYILLEREGTEIVRNLASHEHAIMIHKSQDAKQKVVSSFLDSRGPRGVMFSGGKKFGPEIESIAYNQMMDPLDKLGSMGNLGRWIDGVKSKKVPSRNDGLAAQGEERWPAPRIVGEDEAWFLDNGFADELISLEKQLGPRLRDRMSVLCTYDLHRTPPQYLQDIIASHDYVITDEPVLVFKKSK